MNEKLCIIQDQIDQQPEVSISYFQPDKMKSGGAYIIATGCVKKIDEYEHAVVMRDATKIPIDDIFEIDGELFGIFKNQE